MAPRIQPTRRSARRRNRPGPTTSPYLNSLTINNLTINNIVNNPPSGPEPPNRKDRLITVIREIIKWAGILLLWQTFGD